MKKIAFIAHGPETAESLYPLIDPLKNDFEVHLFAFHPYASKKFGTNLLLMDEFYPIFNEDYSLIITGTSSLHETEKLTPFLAGEKGIPVLSILDNRNRLEERFIHEPNYIISLNEEDTVDLMRLGISSRKIQAFGNPYFDSFVEKVDFYFSTFPFSVAFFLEPTIESEKALYHLFLLKDECPSWFSSIHVIGHPRKDNRWLKDYVKKEHNVSLHPFSDASNTLLGTSVSIGVASFYQELALVIGKPTLFYADYDQMKRDMFHISNQIPAFPLYHFQATKKIIHFIHQLIS